MSEKKEKSTLSSADRVKVADRIEALCREYKITQKQLAERAGIHNNTISKVKKGHIPMSDYVAESIARAFPSFSKEYLKGDVDYRTEQEHFDTLIQKHRDLHQKKIYLLQSIASLRGLEIVPYSTAVNMGDSWENQYILRQGSKQISVPESIVIEWLEDICDFAELMLSRQLKKGDKNG